MLDNVNRIMQRVNPYAFRVDDQFRTSSGFTPEEEEASARLRQFWADGSIPLTEKLQGLEFDFSEFDARNITNRELLVVGRALYKVGLLDRSGVSVMTYPGANFDRSGNQIGQDVKLDALAYLKRQLTGVINMVDGGYFVARDMIPKQTFALTVLSELQKHAELIHGRGLVDVRV